MPKNTQDPLVVVSIMVPRSYITYLDTVSASSDQNRSQIIRAMIRQHMEAQASLQLSKSKGSK